MVKLFGFCGRKRSGKTTLAKIVKEEYNGVIITAANYLKQICCEILVCTLEELNKKKDDGTKFSLYPDDLWYDVIHSRTGIDTEDIKNDISHIEFTGIRQMLQVIGTDCIRKHKPNWHVDCMVEDIKEYLSEGKVVAVDDVRFPNERNAIEELGGECFFMVRPYNVGVSNHVSETSLMWQMFKNTRIIINNKTLETLIESFKIHLKTDFKRDSVHSLLLSEKHEYFLSLKTSFGNERNEFVDRIIEQNKNDESFLNNGVITFSSENYSDFLTLHQLLYSTIPEPPTDGGNTCSVYSIKIYNPLINENLKKFL